MESDNSFFFQLPEDLMGEIASHLDQKSRFLSFGLVNGKFAEFAYALPLASLDVSPTMMGFRDFNQKNLLFRRISDSMASLNPKIFDKRRFDESFVERYREFADKPTMFPFLFRLNSLNLKILNTSNISEYDDYVLTKLFPSLVALSIRKRSDSRATSSNMHVWDFSHLSSLSSLSIFSFETVGITTIRFFNNGKNIKEFRYSDALSTLPSKEAISKIVSTLPSLEALSVKFTPDFSTFPRLTYCKYEIMSQPDMNAIQRLPPGRIESLIIDISPLAAVSVGLGNRLMFPDLKSFSKTLRHLKITGSRELVELNADSLKGLRLESFSGPATTNA